MDCRQLHDFHMCDTSRPKLSHSAPNISLRYFGRPHQEQLLKSIKALLMPDVANSRCLLYRKMLLGRLVRAEMREYENTECYRDLYLHTQVARMSSSSRVAARTARCLVCNLCVVCCAHSRWNMNNVHMLPDADTSAGRWQSIGLVTPCLPSAAMLSSPRMRLW